MSTKCAHLSHHFVELDEKDIRALAEFKEIEIPQPDGTKIHLRFEDLGWDRLHQAIKDAEHAKYGPLPPGDTL